MKILSIVIFSLLTSLGNAQLYDIELAKVLKSQFENDNESFNAIGVSSELVYTFGKNGNKVNAICIEKTKLISTKGDNNFDIWMYKDNETIIHYFNIYTGKKLNKKEDYSNVDCFNNFSEEIFSSDQVTCLYNLEFERKGEIKMFKTKTGYNDVKYLTSTYISEYYPCKERVIIYKIPEWLDLEFHEMNFENFDVKKTETFDSKTKEKIITYTIKNIRSYIEEENSNGFSYLEPHIALVFKSFIKEDGSTQLILSSINDLYQWYKSLVDKVDNQSGKFTELVNNLTKGKETDLEKTKAIFYWVQDNIKYIAFEDGIMGFKPEDAYKVYDKKFGDCKGMANLTKSMLTIAGMDARLTWIGTSHISENYNYSFPSLANDNHMICTVILDSKYYFLDATEDYINFGDYASRIQGRKVLIEDGDNYILQAVPELGKERDKTICQTKLTLEQDKLTGNVYRSYNGELKGALLYSYARLKSDLKEDKLKAFLARSDKNIFVKNYVHSSFENRDTTLDFNYDIEIKNHVTSMGDETYVSLNLSRYFYDLDISPGRKTDYIIGYKPNYVFKTEFEIPLNYRIEYLPEPVIISNDDYKIEFSYETLEKKIIMHKLLIFKSGKITVGNFDAWNKAVKEMNKFYNDQIVLKEII